MESNNKFKVWDRHRKIWLTEQDNICINDGGECYVLIPTAIGEIAARLFDVDVALFTGELDKKANEIYKGDKDAYGNVVEFSGGCWNLNGDRPLSGTSKYFEVVGNIYEDAKPTVNSTS